MTATEAIDAARWDATRSVAVPDPLRPFDDVGLLTPADIHTATALTRAAGDDRAEVLLAAALAVRAPRRRHVCVDLATVETSLVTDRDNGEALPDLPWPDWSGRWIEALAASPAVRTVAAVADEPAVGRSIPPLVLHGTRLYLDRYWRYERQVVGELSRRTSEVDDVDLGALAAGLDRVLLRRPEDERPHRQRLAAATAVLRRFAVIAGGPGTGKTTTVAAILALLHEQARAAGSRPPRIALAAPTGKAAARLTASLHDEAQRLPVDPDIRTALEESEAATLHRLLGSGWGPRFRHHHDDPLPHDVVVVDETSMVSLSLVARLLDAVRGDARVVLLGDPHQLASVEAGTVLGDLVGPALSGLHLGERARDRLAAATGESPGDVQSIMAASTVSDDTPTAALGDGIVVLERVHRYGAASGIAALATAIHGGDPDAVATVLFAGHHDVRWVPFEQDPQAPDPWAADALAAVRDPVVAAGRRLLDAARAGDGAAALDVVDAVRVLCAHRRGPNGVVNWNPRVERWLSQAGVDLDLRRRWYVGRPVIVTRNDHRLGVFNGDVGVTLAGEGGVTVAFAGAHGPRLLHPGRLEAVETVHAMTVHRSQGSQFGHVVVVLPDATSPILTRELLYTAVTRARDRVTVVGAAAAVEAAVLRPISRASGLRAALWGDG